MFSSFCTLRALLVALSSCSLAFSLPSSEGLSGLTKRAFGDYIDNLIYLDANKTSLYAALELGSETYAAKLDNKWDSLIIHAGGNASQTTTLTIGNYQVKVSNQRGEVGFLQDDIDLEYYKATEWPFPSSGAEGVSDAYLGIDINNGMSPIYYYFTSKYPENYSQWFYDILLTYDWKDSVNKVDFAGIMTTGKTLNWQDLFPINRTEADLFGLPHLEDIAKQPELYLTEDGTFYIDNTFAVNDMFVSFQSQVPKTDQKKVVADIQYSRRYSMFPDVVVSALYGKVPGAKYTGESTFGYWTLPCETELKFAFHIDGKEYKIDTDTLLTLNPYGEQCIGTIMTKGQAVAAVPEFDIILGFQTMSSFYHRSGINHNNNKPYYKLLPIDAPDYSVGSSMQWEMASTTYSHSTSVITSASHSHSWPESAVTSAPPTHSWPESAVTSVPPTHSWPESVPTSVPHTWTGSEVATDAPHWTDSGAVPTAEPSNNPAIKAAGNLSTEEDEDEDSADFWRKRAKLFEYIMIALGATLVVTLIIAAILLFRVVRARRQKMAPSAYRNIHDAEMSEPKVALYDAEGGRSRYADPYSDQH